MKIKLPVEKTPSTLHLFLKIQKVVVALKHMGFWSLIGLFGYLYLEQVAQAAQSNPSRSTSLAPPAAVKMSQNPEQWLKLLAESEAEGFWATQGMLALRLPQLIDDADIKFKSMESLIHVTDMGFPLPIGDSLLTSDIEPDPKSSPSPEERRESFWIQDYYFLKSVVNQRSGQERWAEFYRKRTLPFLTDRQFLEKMKVLYREKKLEQVIQNISVFLKNDLTGRNLFWIKQLLRLQARVFFEQKKYRESLQLYRDYLLVMPQVNPLDWIEAAWNHYHLFEYDLALGLLYNLESKSANLTLSTSGSSSLLSGHSAGEDRPTGENERQFVPLEKYLIRGLIYNRNCMKKPLQNLIAEFEAKFLGVLNGLKTGLVYRPTDSLIGVLELVDTTVTRPYIDEIKVLSQLQSEKNKMSSLSSTSLRLGQSFVEMEIVLLKEKRNKESRKWIDAALNEIVKIHESLRFLAFDLQREELDPIKLEKKKKQSRQGLYQIDPESKVSKVNWAQSGDFWFQERQIYKGAIVELCK